MSQRFRWAFTANFPGAFFSIAESLVMIFTLGWVCPSWHVRFLIWRMEKEMDRRARGLPTYR